MSGSTPSRLQAALELAALGIPLVPAHHPLPDRLGRCSCGRVGCPTPARHVPLGLDPQDATTYQRVLRRWWGGGGEWNLAVVAGRLVDVVELAYPRPAGEVAAWLGEHKVEAGPVIDLGGTVGFLTTPRRHPAGERQPIGSGWVARPAHGELVLVPPSRQVGGRTLSWLVGPHLPFCDPARLWDALSVLPSPERLAAWAAEREHDQHDPQPQHQHQHPHQQGQQGQQDRGDAGDAGDGQDQQGEGGGR